VAVVEEFNINPEVFYRNRGKAEALILEVDGLIATENWEVLKNFREKENSQCFYFNILKAVTFYHYGNIKKAKDHINNYCEQLLKIKKYHRIEEAKNIITRMKCPALIKEEILEVANFCTARKIDCYKTGFSFNTADILNNSNLYYTNEKIFFDLMSLASRIENPALVIETLLKSVKIIAKYQKLEDFLLKFATELNSPYLLDSLNKSDLYRESDVKNDTEEITYDENFYYEFSQEEYVVDDFLIARQKFERGDYLGAISYYREMLFGMTLNREKYLNIVRSIAACYQKMGRAQTAEKLKRFAYVNSEILRKNI
jgi:hypothetical protein